MENKTYVQRLDALQNEVTHFLCTEFHNMKKYWKTSKTFNAQVLKIKKENLQFKLSGSRYLEEFDGIQLIDNFGYTYNFYSLTIDQLCILADAIKSRKF